MTKSHSLKADGKPMLFSYDLETETANIALWAKANPSDAKSVEILTKLASDYIEIIESGNLSADQLARLYDAIAKGKSGIWERASTRLELLSYHFENARQFIADSIRNAKGATVERLLTMVSDNFSSNQQLAIFESALDAKNKKVRSKAAEMCLDSRNMDLIPMLESKFSLESDPIVKSSIRFAIQNMHQPKGELFFDMEDEDDD